MRTLSVSEAARIVRKGGIVACPTETFYGLAVDPRHVSAIRKIFRIKRRERKKPILLIVSSVREVKRWAVGIGPREKKLMRRFWPGPLTLVMRARASVPSLLTAGTRKIGLRLSSEPVARRLARLSGGAITGTSANISGKKPASTAKEVSQQLGMFVDAIVSGRTLKPSKGSTILDVTGKRPRVLREGAVSASRIEKVFHEATF